MIITAEYYKERSFKLANFLVDEFNDIPDMVYFLNLSMAIELLLKNLIIFQVFNVYKNKDKNETNYQLFLIEVRKEMRRASHCLNDLLSFDEDLKSELSIKFVEKKENEFIDQYVVSFNNGDILIIPTLEALRYGPFSSQGHVAEFYDKKLALKFVTDIKRYVESRVVYY